MPNIDNIDDFWKCEHERENEQNTLAGIILTFVGLFLVSKYIDKYKESSRRLREIAERQLAMSKTLKDHYIDVVHPQRVHAITSALGMPIPSLAVSQAEFDESNIVDRMKAQRDSLLNDNISCGDYGCFNNIEIAGSLAMADSSYSRKQFNRRRYERRIELKRRLVTKAHAASQQQAQVFFQLLNTAASIYSSILQNAQSNLAGATATLGQGLGMFGSGI